MSIVAMLFIFSCILVYGIDCFITHINPEVKPDIIHTLDDTNFDFYLQEGRNYQWLIMFMTESCEHCITGKEVVRKVFSQINHDNIRFAEVMDVGNPLTLSRFEVDGFPTIIMIHNGKMCQFKKVLEKNNLLNYIGSYQKTCKGISLPPQKRLYYLILLSFQSHLSNYKHITQAILNFFSVKTDNLFPYQVVVFIQVLFMSVLVIEGFLLWIISKFCSKYKDEQNGNESKEEDKTDEEECDEEEDNESEY